MKRLLRRAARPQRPGPSGNRVTIPRVPRRSARRRDRSARGSGSRARSDGRAGALPARVRPFADPAFYPHRPESVELIQTHISWVFLAGEYVYKVKKPVYLGFLDF